MSGSSASTITAWITTKSFPIDDQLKYPQPGRYVRHEQVVQIGTLNRFPTKDWIDMEGSIVEVMKELRGRH